MLSCKESTRLISSAHDRRLAMPEKLSLEMHLLICSGCRNYREQLAFVDRACDTYKERLEKDGVSS